MTYPRTLSEIRDNEIGKLVCSLQNVEVSKTAKKGGEETENRKKLI
jgi:hypothetical protein